MNVGSLFSGIGGFDLGLERAGHRVVFQCESDPYRRRVLARHWPGVPCFEDVRAVRAGDTTSRTTGGTTGRRTLGGKRDSHDTNRTQSAGLFSDVNLLCGGFPCQDLSVAGKRAGLDGERSGLFFEFARIADDFLGSGGWLLIENVPGLLSSNGGRDFAVLLATLAELGFHDLAWRVLDSRYLGVPQRRRRVFILARRARGRRASEVLLEPESGGGDFEAGGTSREGIAGSVADGADSARSLTASERWDGETEDFIASPSPDPGGDSASPSFGGEGQGSHERSETGGDGSEAHPDRDRAPAGVPGRVDGPVMAHFRTREEGSCFEEVDLPNVSRASVGGSGGAKLALFGGGEATDRCAHDPKPDGPRYAACGDAVTVQVAEWIGRRLP